MVDLAYILVALKRLFVIISSSIKDNLGTIGLYLWDILLVLYNLITPDLPAGQVIPEGNPGHNGLWPKYAPPGEGDSRSPCPGLNAMANHGTLFGPTLHGRLSDTVGRLSAMSAVETDVV